MDLRPVHSGHLPVVPVVHAVYLANLSEEGGARVFRVAQQLSAALHGPGLGSTADKRGRAFARPCSGSSW